MHARTGRKHQAMHSWTVLLSLLVVMLGAVCLGAWAWAAPARAPERQRPTLGKAWRVKSLIELPAQPIAIASWLQQHGWESKRHDPSRFEVGGHLLHLVSRDDSIMIGTQQGFPIDPNVWRWLRVRLRVTKTPVGTELTKKSGDDAAFRLYVAFDRGGWSWYPPHTLVYTWTENVEPDTFIDSPHFSSVLRYISIGKGLTLPAKQAAVVRPQTAAASSDAEPGWVTITRDLVHDYRRAFPDEAGAVPAVVGILLKSDSNDTATSAEAWLSLLQLLAPRR